MQNKSIFKLLKKLKTGQRVDKIQVFDMSKFCFQSNSKQVSGHKNEFIKRKKYKKYSIFTFEI